MRKIIFFILIIAIVALFIVPEETIGEYKGLLRAKYFLKDTAVKTKSIILALLRGEKSEELKNLEVKMKEGKEALQKKTIEEISTTTKKVIDAEMRVE